MAPEGLPPPSLLRRFHETLEAPIDPAGLAAFRVLFGVLVAAGSARFLASGFIHKLYQEDAFYFRYAGLEWIPVPAPSTVELLYVLCVPLGVFIAAGLFFRAALLAFLVLFAWVQLIDVTNYLNHYYLVLLLGSLLLLSPAHACFSLDARYFGAQRDRVPFFFLALLRFQVACVYVFAAIAKVGTDWLLAG